MSNLRQTGNPIQWLQAFASPGGAVPAIASTLASWRANHALPSSLELQPAMSRSRRREEEVWRVCPPFPHFPEISWKHSTTEQGVCIPLQCCFMGETLQRQGQGVDGPKVRERSWAGATGGRAGGESSVVSGTGCLGDERRSRCRISSLQGVNVRRGWGVGRCADRRMFAPPPPPPSPPSGVLR